jgi:uncharacterized membrane protein
MNPLNKYKFKEKLLKAGSLAWYSLVWFSKITLFFFILITCITFWENEALILLENGVNILNQVSQMLLIITISIILIAIDYISKLTLKNKNENTN